MAVDQNVTVATCGQDKRMFSECDYEVKLLVGLGSLAILVTSKMH